MVEFVHLHVHSHYSLLDGLNSPKALARRAAELGMPALAITDHGALYGVVAFYQAAREAGIKPIIGIETYLARRGMKDRSAVEDRKPYHLLLLAQNQAGYQNLLRLATIAMLEGFYYKPRVDKQVLAEHNDGLIVTTGCGSSEIPRLIQQGRLEEARRTVAWYRDVFPGRFFLELQSHDIPELDVVNRHLLVLGREFGLPLVATNDVHYILREQAPIHDILLCIGTGKSLNDPKRMRMDGATYYMRTPEEMAHLFAEVPEALTNTLRIAEMCHVELDFDHYHLPPFQVPEGHTPESYLRALCEEGLRRRYGERGDSPEVRERLEHELTIIHQMGFDTYFLIVWDLCQAARKRDIWYNARGSAAGSIVAYSLRITMVDPLANGLIFERFLNPGRVSMPDIDLDFPDDRRGEMIEYTVRKYGQENVAQIITFGTLGARAAVRDVGRVMDIPLLEVDRIAKMIPSIPGKPMSIPQALEQVPELRQLYETTPYVHNLLDAAAQLEGVARHASTHAAGVVIADAPLVEYCPLNRPTRGESTPGTEAQGTAPLLNAVTQWPMEDLDAIGLLKVDFLGLSTLTVMRRACDLIRERHGVELDLDSIPLDDPEIYRLLSSGDVAGIFQVEGSGFRRVLREMRPSRYEHIVAVLALYRPGPMEHIRDYIRRMHGQETVEYRHPALAPILDETFGITVFQEQIIRIATDLSGYTAGEADLLRRGVAKKKKKELLRHRKKFVQGAVKNGIPEETAAAIFDDIEYFARYGFNKSHAADYAVLTCQTAYLKAHYPVEYMTALLTVERNNTDKIGVLVGECRRMGIEILPPNVNRSGLIFTIEDRSVEDGLRASSAIRFGLGAVKNVGDGPVEVIIEARQERPFRDLGDFCRRVDLRTVNRRALDSLIRVGALSDFGPRARLLAALDRMMSLSTRIHRAREIGQMSLFGEATGVRIEDNESLFAGLTPAAEAPQREILEWEKELAGAYLSEHPLVEAMRDLGDVITAYAGQLHEEQPDQTVTVVGEVRRVRHHTTRNGKEMAFVTLEDPYGACDVVVFPRVWAGSKEMWLPDRVVVVRGKVNVRHEQPSLICQWVKTVQEVIEPRSPQATQPRGANAAVHAHAPRPTRRTVRVTIQRTGDAERDFRLLSAVHELLISYPGEDRFAFLLTNGPNGDQLLEFPNHSTRYCRELGEKLADLVGADAVEVREG
ncbi:MAG TPA: DNA polymerase III subunit alpha [Chloroflexi bacterium]|nr:DNA polymerase III subunit alpha [Chloroflexota bacterium]